MARDWILAGHIIWRGRPLNSFAVSRAANSISPDQTEPTMFAKNISKIFQQKTKLVISVFSALGILFISKMKCFSLKSAQTLMKSRTCIMLAAIHRGLHCLPNCLFWEKGPRVKTEKQNYLVACCSLQKWPLVTSYTLHVSSCS